MRRSLPDGRLRCRARWSYCPVDALFVAPHAERAIDVDEAQLEAEGSLGSYRAALGWTKAGPVVHSEDLAQRLHEFRQLNTRRLSSSR